MTNEVNYDDEIQRLWDSQNSGEAHAEPKVLAQAMRAANKKEQRARWGLVLQETVPAVVVSVYFLWESTNVATGARQWALIGAALIGLAVAGFLVATTLRQRASEQVYGSSLVDELEHRRSQLAHRVKLYRSVAWWYFAPLSLAIALAYSAFREPGALRAFDVGYAAAAIVGGIVLYVMNRRIGRNRFEPELQSVSSLVDDLNG